MMVHNISFSSVGPISEIRGISKEDGFILALLYYFTSVHETILKAWEQFRENQQEIRERKEESMRVHFVEHRWREGIRLERQHRHPIDVQPYLFSHNPGFKVKRLYLL